MRSAEHETVGTIEAQEESLLRDLFLFAAGGQTFGIFAEEVEGTADAKRPTPLPGAAPAVLGVVYVRGRMLTLLDPAALSSGEVSSWPAGVSAIVSLRDDEQLGLAADSLGGTITISSSDIEIPANEGESVGNDAILGILLHGGERITILNKSRLFSSAVQRKERRRRRF